MSLSYAWSLYETGNIAAAEREARRELADRPENAHAICLLAHCAIARRKKTEARELAQQAIGIDPDSPEGWLLIGNVDASDGLYIAAREAYERAITLDPEMSHAHTSLAMLHDAFDRDAEARRHYELAVGLSPDDAFGLVRYAIFLRKKNEDAGDVLMRAAELAPDSPEVNVLLGEIAFSNGNLAEATDRAMWVLGNDSEDTDALILLTRIKASRNPALGVLLRATLWLSELEMKRKVGFGLIALVLFIIVRNWLLSVEPVLIHHVFVTLVVALGIFVACADAFLETMVEREKKAVQLRQDF